MPIYEYVCSACERRVEVIHGIAGTGPATCATCGGAMRKALTAPAIHFKGSGWAKKDARSSAAPAATATKSEEGGAPSGDGPPAPAAGSKESPAPVATPAVTAPAAAPAASGADS